MASDNIIPKRVLTNEEISMLLIGGYNVEARTTSDGLIGDVRTVKRDQRIFFAGATALLLPVAIEALKALFGIH